MSEHDRNSETMAWNGSANGACPNLRDDPRLTAYALGELEALDEESVAAIAAAVSRDPELRQYVEELRAAGETLGAELGATGSLSATGATESSSSKDGRLASAEALMAAAFPARAGRDTQNVSASAERPHAAAGSGRRARAVQPAAPSPFRRYFAVGTVAAMLVVAVLVGLMVASYGAQSPATPVAADVQAPAQFENMAQSMKVVKETLGSEKALELDSSLELQIGQYKPGDGQDSQAHGGIGYDNGKQQEPTVVGSIASTNVVQDVFVPSGTGGATSSSGGTSGGLGWVDSQTITGPAVSQRAAVIHRRNQKISRLLEEIDKVTDENLKMGEERLQTSLAWAPEKYKPTTDVDPYYLDSQEVVHPDFDSAHAVDLQINGMPQTLDGTWHAMNEEEFSRGVPVWQILPEDPAPSRGPVRGLWLDGPEQRTADLLAELGDIPGSRITEALVPIDVWLTYSESPRRAGRPLGDSTITADAKPEAEVAEAQEETESSQSLTKRAEEIAKLHKVIVKSQQGVTPANPNESLRQEIDALKAKLAQMSKNRQQPIMISNADGFFENAYGPNAPVTTKSGKLTMGGLAQVWFYTIQKENVAVGLSRDSGINLNDVYNPTVAQERVDYSIQQPMEFAFRYDVMSNLFDRGRVVQGQNDFNTQVKTAGVNYFIKGHNAKLTINYKTVVEDDVFALKGWYAATGYRLGDKLWADRGPTRGLWTRGEWSGARSPATPAPEAPGGMVVWQFNAKDAARGQANDLWRLTRVGGRFGDLMSSIGDYRIGGAVKDGGLALVGVDGEFDHGRMGYVAPHPDEGRSTESYAVVAENPFEKARTISTFSIDVDTASYSNVRRFLTDGSLPPPGAVRYEEMINYFRYAYEPPPSDAKEPFATHAEVATCPWNAAHRLIRIALKGREIDPNSRPSSNLVFLVDVSGSMSDANKLDLVRQGLNLLVDNLNARDRVAIVTYSDKIQVELESTPCDQKRRILERINALSAGGSTNGGDGIQKAYAIAAKNFIAGGTNRVILCTDGDFNVGTTSNDELVKLIEQKAKGGVFLSVLGFGMGNYKDDKLEAIADKGNGHYAYIDSFQEAKKVFGQELAGTLVTIAKDVKVQVEFNPAAAHSYRLIGYENRLMRKEDFADDTKDAGEIGAGHTVTALYEVIPAGAEEAVQPVRVPLDVMLLNAKPEEVAKLAFLWKQTGGPKADLRDADRPVAYFLPTADGEYEFEVSAIADATVVKTTVKRTVKLAELAAPKAPAERASRYLDEAKVKEDAKTNGELLTVWLRYKQPEDDKSTELSVPVRDAGKKLEQSSQDFRFASSVAAFGMLLRGSVYAKNLNWDFVLELAGESKGADAEGQRAEFIDLAKKARALSR